MIRLLKEMLIMASALIALAYLMLPSALPDFIPIIGWMDEGAAMLTLTNALSYYGLDLTNIYGRRPTKKRRIVRRVRQEPTDQSHDEDVIPAKPRNKSPIRYD
jgi:uncharacterized membrane protein YkvA (DUF1232 family)